MNASRDRWKESMPSVAKLYDSIRVQTAGVRSTIEFTVDRTLAANSQRVIDEVLAAAFGGLGIRVNPPSAEAAGRADRHRAGRVPPRGDPGRAACLRSAGPVRRGGGPDPGPVRGEARRAAPGRGAAGGIARRIVRGGPRDRGRGFRQRDTERGRERGPRAPVRRQREGGRRPGAAAARGVRPGAEQPAGVLQVDGRQAAQGHEVGAAGRGRRSEGAAEPDRPGPAPPAHPDRGGDPGPSRSPAPPPSGTARSSRSPRIAPGRVSYQIAGAGRRLLLFAR